MILDDYLSEHNTSVTITFTGSKPASVQGVVMTYDEHHIILFTDGKENYIPWSAVGMVTNLTKTVQLP